MAKRSASFLLTGGGGGCGCGRSRPGTLRQDRPPLRRCPMRGPRARPGAWLSTWLGPAQAVSAKRVPQALGGSPQPAGRPSGSAYCPRVPAVAVATAAAALSQVAAAAVAVAAAALDMLSREDPQLERKVGGRWSLLALGLIPRRDGSIVGKRTLSLACTLSPCALGTVRTGCLAGLLARSSGAPEPGEQPRRFPAGGCGELRRKTTAARGGSGRARPSRVTARCSYQKP